MISQFCSSESSSFEREPGAIGDDWAWFAMTLHLKSKDRFPSSSNDSSSVVNELGVELVEITFGRNGELVRIAGW